MSEAERIADGLSEAQRKLVVWAEDDYLRLIPREALSAKALQRRGLGRCIDTWEGRERFIHYWNNALGLQVRQILLDRGRE